jgi:UDP-N-acetylglucosamine kinase
MDDSDISRKAEEFARENRNSIAKELTDKSKFVPETNPISVFMAGSPGAGKTEFSKSLIEILEEDNEHKVVRIDADDLRGRMPGYTGKNSYLFQTAVSLIVERVHDFVLDNKQTFLLDGTLSNYNKAADNISRSVSKGRLVLVFYVYQTPQVAWKFTQAREAAEGRNIPKAVFIDQFLASRETIEKIHTNFTDKVVVYLVKKNFETHAVDKIINLSSSDKQIDHYLGESYNKVDLEKIL